MVFPSIELNWDASGRSSHTKPLSPHYSGSSPGFGYTVRGDFRGVADRCQNCLTGVQFLDQPRCSTFPPTRTTPGSQFQVLPEKSSVSSRWLLTIAPLARHTNVDREQEIQTRERLTRLWLKRSRRCGRMSAPRYGNSTTGGRGPAGGADGRPAVRRVRRFTTFLGLGAVAGEVTDCRSLPAAGTERRLFSEGLLDRLAAALVSQQAELPARQALERCLERLPEKSRRLLTLRYAEDASVAEVATAVQSTAGAVRVMLFRIRNLLSQCIEEQLANEASGP